MAAGIACCLHVVTGHRGLLLASWLLASQAIAGIACYCWHRFGLPDLLKILTDFSSGNSFANPDLTEISWSKNPFRIGFQILFTDPDPIIDRNCVFGNPALIDTDKSPVGTGLYVG